MRQLHFVMNAKQTMNAIAQQLALLKELAVRIHEDEQNLEGLVQESPALNYVRSLPGMGPILAAVVVGRDRRHRALPLGSEALWLRRGIREFSIAGMRFRTASARSG